MTGKGASRLMGTQAPKKGIDLFLGEYGSPKGRIAAKQTLFHQPLHALCGAAKNRRHFLLRVEDGFNTHAAAFLLYAREDRKPGFASSQASA